MTIRFQCEACGKTLKVSDSHAGKEAKCPSCGKRVVIPAPAVVPSAETDAEDFLGDEWTMEAVDESDGPASPSGEMEEADNGIYDGFHGAEEDLSYVTPALPPRQKKKKKKKLRAADSEESPYAAPDYRESVPQVSRREESNEPAWGHAFMIACICIMIATRGGAIWGAVGGGVGGLRLKISKETQLPLAARIVACTLITGTLWAGIIGLVISVS